MCKIWHLIYLSEIRVPADIKLCTRPDECYVDLSFTLSLDKYTFIKNIGEKVMVVMVTIVIINIMTQFSVEFK